MKNLIILVIFIISVQINAQNLPKVAYGKIERIENFHSKFVADRHIDVWLPEGYNPSNKYSVIYMHDGQMLFDSTITWNNKEWKADEVFTALIKKNQIKPCIIVGIWNTPDRIVEYFPNKIYNRLDPGMQKVLSEKFGNNKPANGDNYLKFVVNELKPYIDSHFSTLPDKENTYIIGSSLGGLISLYAFAEYPEVFGGAASLSTAWLSFIEPNFNFPLAMFNYFAENLPTATDRKLYMDYGTGESDKPYELTQGFIDLIAKGKGYSEQNLKTLIFENDIHDEISWSHRLNIPVTFLLGQ